jgi:hypothetical protein
VVRIWLCHVHTHRIVASGPDPSPESWASTRSPAGANHGEFIAPTPVRVILNATVLTLRAV